MQSARRIIFFDDTMEKNTSKTTTTTTNWQRNVLPQDFDFRELDLFLRPQLLDAFLDLLRDFDFLPEIKYINEYKNEHASEDK